MHPIFKAGETGKKIRYMTFALATSLVIGVLKFYAYSITQSNAILTDAFESLINVSASAFALFSLIYSSKPKDESHPYGHGKIEFFSVGFEGALILFSGGAILLTAVYHLFYPDTVHQIGVGILLTLTSGAVNFLLGYFLVKKGKELNSMTLKADGEHLLTDTWSSLILIGGLGVIYLTDWLLLDSLLSIGMTLFILLTGFRLIKNALSGLMDETDYHVLSEVVEALNIARKAEWIDIHNLRVLKYGSSIHIDAHLTLPYYFDLTTSHQSVKEIESAVSQKFGNRVELFIHTDPCKTTSCKICTLENCKVRSHELREKIHWNLKNLMKDIPHGLNE